MIRWRIGDYETGMSLECSQGQIWWGTLTIGRSRRAYRGGLEIVRADALKTSGKHDIGHRDCESRLQWM